MLFFRLNASADHAQKKHPKADPAALTPEEVSFAVEGSKTYH